MITPTEFTSLAMALPETSEQPHFEKISFRVSKKIFATLDEQLHTATLKLSVQDQAMFAMADKTAIAPVNNKWGTQGWTTVDLKLVSKDIFVHALDMAYCCVAPRKLAAVVMEKYG